MQILKTCFALLLLLVPCTNVAAQFPAENFLQRKAADWEKLPDLAKLGYVMGYIDSEQLYRVILVSTKPACSEEQQTNLDKFLNSNPRPAATYGQLVAGIDEFYEDWRNKNISIAFVMRVVGLELAGRSQAEIDEVVRTLREASSED